MENCLLKISVNYILQINKLIGMMSEFTFTYLIDSLSFEGLTILVYCSLNRIFGIIVSNTNLPLNEKKKENMAIRIVAPI